MSLDSTLRAEAQRKAETLQGRRYPLTPHDAVAAIATLGVLAAMYRAQPKIGRTP